MSKAKCFIFMDDAQKQGRHLPALVRDASSSAIHRRRNKVLLAKIAMLRRSVRVQDTILKYFR